MKVSKKKRPMAFDKREDFSHRTIHFRIIAFTSSVKQ